VSLQRYIQSRQHEFLSSSQDDPLPSSFFFVTGNCPFYFKYFFLGRKEIFTPLRLIWPLAVFGIFLVDLFPALVMAIFEF